MTKINETSAKKLASLPVVGTKPANEKEEAYLNEVAEYEFNNLEEPGLAVEFPYGSTKKNAKFAFAHGQKYKIPRHVARHVESCSTPNYAWKPNGSGQLVKTLQGTKARFQMRPIFS